jgi:Putative abortive phage resistance protein AbiGi, antitoxin
MLGYFGRSDWQDMSEYVVHFTADTDDGSAERNLHAILTAGQLRLGPNRFGAARRLDALGDSQRSVCFSEIPLGFLDRLVERRSRYGIGFSQDLILAAGGARVWYVDKDTPVARAFDRLLQRDIDPWNGESPLWNLTPFVDFPGDYGDTMYRFEWEREWRVPGNFTFTIEDVAFLLVPEDEHDALRRAFPGHLPLLRSCLECGEHPAGGRCAPHGTGSDPKPHVIPSMTNRARPTVSQVPSSMCSSIGSHRVSPVPSATAPPASLPRSIPGGAG